MFLVLMPFNSVSRRFSPERTPEITEGELEGCAVPAEVLEARGYIARKPDETPAEEPMVEA